MAEEQSVFDEAEMTEEIEETEENFPQEESQEEWKPSISDESPKARAERKGIKDKADGKILTIKSVFFTRPKIKDMDGIPIPPKKTISGDKEFYSGKLGVRFEEDNLVEYYPNFHYFVNEGKVSNFAKINRSGKSQITEIFNLVVKKLNKPVDEISDKEVYDYLIGKKVKIKTVSGIYLKRPWFRNDIVEIL